MTDAASFIHSDYREWIELIKFTAALPAPTLETIGTNRANPNPMLKPPLESPAWETRTIPGPAGAPDVEVVIVNAGREGVPRPAILHTHGGGFLYMHAKDVVFMLQETAAALDCVIVSVDYRLAPETPFPGSLEDNYAALKWLHAHADTLGADPKRIALMGESAGGGHAAMLAIAARDRGEVPVIYQALTYPMLDDRTGSTRAVPPHIGAFIWRAVENAFGWSCFLGVPAGSQTVPYGAVPARVEDLRGLPPAFIAVGSIDLFVAEDIEYARRLNDAGVPVELHVYPGCVHAFDVLPTDSAARLKAALRKALAGAFAQ
jgi:acetyl esterase/lipase